MSFVWYPAALSRPAGLFKSLEAFFHGIEMIQFISRLTNEKTLIINAAK